MRPKLNALGGNAMFLALIPAPIMGIISILIFAINTCFWCFLLYLFVPLRLLIPIRGFRTWCTEKMIALAQNWITVNNLEMKILENIEWDVQGLDSLHMDRSYLVCSNHQSWVDIVVLQKVFNRIIPFLRFFLKRELVWVPVLGPAWWALDFPFMKRYSKNYLLKHPEKRGQDLETTRRACEKFSGSRISVLNFLEGTRFSSEKRNKQNSPYVNLLQPKTGGVAFTVDAMGRQFHSLVDVTIFYPGGAQSMWGLFTGRVRKVVVRIEEIPIPAELLGGNYLDDEDFRMKMQSWIRSIWERKDRLLTQLKSQPI
jgi:1-acyl-sn-glycerol-3-phosphate acyltransferase